MGNQRYSYKIVLWPHNKPEASLEYVLREVETGMRAMITEAIRQGDIRPDAYAVLRFSVWHKDGDYNGPFTFGDQAKWYTPAAQEYQLVMNLGRAYQSQAIIEDDRRGYERIHDRNPGALWPVLRSVAAWKVSGLLAWYYRHKFALKRRIRAIQSDYKSKTTDTPH